MVTTFRPTFAPKEQPSTFVIEEDEGDEEASGDILGQFVTFGLLPQMIIDQKVL